MDFWTRLDELINAHEIVIDRPKSSHHPKNPEIVYPFDYGYLRGTSSGDGNEIDVCRGTPGPCWNEWKASMNGVVSAYPLMMPVLALPKTPRTRAADTRVRSLLLAAAD